MTADLTPQGAAAVRLAATVVQLKAERDRARGIAVRLEQQVSEAAAALNVALYYASNPDTHSKHTRTDELAGCAIVLRDLRALGADQ